jgi:hypothetical protein
VVLRPAFLSLSPNLVHDACQQLVHLKLHPRLHPLPPPRISCPIPSHPVLYTKGAQC